MRTLAFVGLSAVAVAVAVDCWQLSRSASVAAPTATAHRVAAPASRPAPPPSPAGDPAAATPPPGTTFVASTHGAIPGYASPDAVSDMTVPASFFGYPSVLPVIASQPDWLEVRLAQRPNGSTTWVQQSDVTLSDTPYEIVVNLATMHLVVYRDGRAVLDFPAGIGAPDSPTPTGEYFVFATVPPPNASYGPFVLATSDHSDTFTDWENSGDAIIGIHGPITSYDDSLIGNTGAAISNGCIRLHDADLAQLAMIPPGTPIVIAA